jgi:aminoglycoside 6'-N-acetyltransferase I
MIHIIEMSAASEAQRRETAELLVAAFVEMAPEAWPTVEDAEREVAESLAEDRISLMALDEANAVVGWVGGISGYEGNVWELHPLAVRPDAQGRGIGRALTLRLEEEVRARGGLTVWLGTDDVAGMTSLAGEDLYPDPIARLASIRNVRRHPYEFYRRLGYCLAGIVPDANGFGRPDILMAKRVAEFPVDPVRLGASSSVRRR